jgi:hypothetical protein
VDKPIAFMVRGGHSIPSVVFERDVAEILYRQRVRSYPSKPKLHSGPAPELVPLIPQHVQFDENGLLTGV